MRSDILAGLASLLVAASYLVGFMLLLGPLAPLNYGSETVSAPGVVAFHLAQPWRLPLWNTVIYDLSALGTATMGLALSALFRPDRRTLAGLLAVLAMLWSGFTLASGMMARTGLAEVSRLGDLYPAQAAETWHVLHLVETGLSGRTEILGGIWIGLASLAGLHSGRASGALATVGLVVALAGMATYVPIMSDLMGAVFGIGAVLWFLWFGMDLLTSARHLGDEP